MNGIRILREELGLTQTQFGQKINLTQKNVSDLEKAASIKFETLETICDKFDIKAESVFTGTVEKDRAVSLDQEIEQALNVIHDNYADCGKSVKKKILCNLELIILNDLSGELGRSGG